jgi:hypothetical protein
LCENRGREEKGYLVVKFCQKMARFLKITKYKLQNTNKFQITMSEITNSPIGLKNPVSYSSPKAFKYVRRTPDVCNLYFVICNFPDKPVPFWFRLVRAVDRQIFDSLAAKAAITKFFKGLG